uniref:OST-HTH/LOTUS domain-containing protein n=1 Tax=Phascolarctobacterium faecium TaxID=33025 RepID=UPI003AB8BDDB
FALAKLCASGHGASSAPASAGADIYIFQNVLSLKQSQVLNVSSAGQFIKRVKPDFDVRTFGFIKLPKLIEAFPRKYEIKKYPGKGKVTIIAYRCK